MAKDFMCSNDHFLLQSIFKRSILKAPPRIQRFLLRLQRYDFERHDIQAKFLSVADTLSRASLNDSTPEIKDTKIELNCYAHAIKSNYRISDYRLQQFQHETKTDKSRQTFLVFTQNG